MADTDHTASIGVAVDPTQGEAGSKRFNVALDSMGKKAEETQRRVKGAMDNLGTAVNRGLTPFEKASALMSRYSLSTLSALRALGPFAGETVRMAEGLERASARMERMAYQQGQTARGQVSLNQAFREGTLRAATHEAALAHLTESQVAFSNAQKLANNLTSEAAIAAQNVTQAKLRYTDAERNLSAASTDTRRAWIELEKAQRAVSAAENDAASTVSALTAAKALLATKSREVAEAERLEQDARAGATAGMTGMIAVVGGVIAILAVLVVTIEAVKKAWDFVRDSMKAAASEQSARLTFQNLIGDAKLANEQFERLRDFWKETGLFNLDELQRAVEQFNLLGATAKNSVTYTEALAAGAAHVGSTVGKMAQAFETLMIGRIQRPTLEAKAIIAALAADTGRSLEQVGVALRKHEFTAEQLAHAIENAAKAEGIWGNAIARRQQTYEGQLARLRAQWEAFKQSFGAPVIDALTGILTRWNITLGDGESLAQKWGMTFSDWIDRSAQLLEKLVGVFGKVKSTMTGFWDDLVQGWHDIGNRAQGLTGASGVSGDVGVSVASGSAEGTLPAKPDAGTNNWLKFRDPSASRGNNSGWTQIKTDAQIIADYWSQASQIQGEVSNATEKERRLLELTLSTSKELYDPSNFNPYYNALGALIAKEAEHERAMHTMEERIKVGAATAAQAWQYGIQKAVDAWGNGLQQIAELAGNVVNRIADGLTQGFTDWITGAKSAKDAFRDMAVSMLRDIAQMIIRMLILKAISSALGYFGVATPTVQYSSAIGPAYASGGATRGYPHMAMLGERGQEFVFNTSATRNAGIDRLYRAQAAFERGGFNPEPTGTEIPVEPDLNFPSGPDLGTQGQPGNFHGGWDVPMAGTPRQFLPSSGQYNPQVWNPFMQIGSTNVYGGEYRGLVYGPNQSGGEGWHTVFTPGSLSGVLAGRGTTGGGAGWTAPGNFMGQAGLHHTGGVVGVDPTVMRLVDMRIFANARRMHNGGVVGDEVPIIAKRGERVVTEAAWQGRGGPTTNITQLTIMTNHYAADGSTTSSQKGSDSDSEALAREIQPFIDRRIQFHQRDKGFFRK